MTSDFKIFFQGRVKTLIINHFTVNSLLLTSHRSTLSIVLKVKEPTVAVRLRLVTLDGNWATINSCSTGLAEKSRFGEIVISSRPFCTDAFALNS